MTLKDKIKSFCDEKNITFKDLAEKALMNEKSLHNKFNRNTLTVKDLQLLLIILEKKIEVVPCDPCESLTEKGQNHLPPNISVYDLDIILKACNRQITLVNNSNKGLER